MLSKYKIYSNQKLETLGRKLSWVDPNALTIIGIIPQALFFYFMQAGQLTAAAIALVFTALDMLDGAIARANNKVSRFGGFLDSTIDRIGDFLMIAGLYAAGLASLPLVAVLAMATFMISYARARAELAADGKMKFDYGMIERPERIAFVLLIVLVEIFFPGSREAFVTALTVLSIYTVIQRIWQAYRKLTP